MRVPLSLLLAMVVASGCLGAAPGAQVDAQSTDAGALVRIPMTIHVVAVGFEDFDEAALMEQLKPPTPVYAGIRYTTTAGLQFEPLQYDVTFAVHEAPEAFAQALFGHVASTVETAGLDPWLARYDVQGEKRACEPGQRVGVAPAPVQLVVSPDTCGDMDVADARSVEGWIADNRAAHGLAFEAPSQTVFVLDSYTKGWLPKDRYHRYAIDDGTGAADLTRLRAWGGDHDFVFLDVGAAPNSYDHRPWINFTSDEGWGEPDLPVWDLADDMPTFYRNLAWNVRDAVDMLWARDPIYPFEHAERYLLPIHVFIDPNAHANPESPLARLSPQDFEKGTNAELIQQEFQALLPWAQVEVTIDFHYLPDGDDAMADVLADAKDRSDPRYVDFGIVKRHLRDNWATYAPEEAGARTYPTFAFVLDAPSRGIYAYSDGDEMGDSFGVFINLADTFTSCGVGRPVCPVQDLFGEDAFWLFWNSLILHEAGHSFGLMHPHDTFDLDEEGESSGRINWLWDSTSSPMTYRHVLGKYNRFDKELVLRGNAVNLARDVLQKEGAPEEARATALQALDATRRGAYAEGLDLAVKGKRLAGDGMAAFAGAIGEPLATPLSIPATGAPLGSVPWPVYNLPIALVDAAPYIVADTLGLSSASIPVEVPEGAQALLLEYREGEITQEASRHPKWAAFAMLLDHEEEFVLGLFNNGHDKAVLLDVDRCSGGCTLVVYGYSGANLAYDVSVTPYAT